MIRTFVAIQLLAASLFAATGQTINGSAASGGQTATFTIPVTWQPGLVATGTCPSSTIVSGTTMVCTVTISIPVPAGQTGTVTLGSSDTTKITVPATVTIPAGATSVTFTLTAL
jgi:hypothetical protein